MIDGFTRYGNAVIVKNISSTLEAFIKTWLGIFGATTNLFNENGGEFISNKLYDMCKKFSMKVTTVSSYSPHIE